MCLAVGQVAAAKQCNKFLQRALLNPFAGYAILKTGKAIEAATLNSKNLIYIRPSLVRIVAAIFLFP